MLNICRELNGKLSYLNSYFTNSYNRLSCKSRFASWINDETSKFTDLLNTNDNRALCYTVMDKQGALSSSNKLSVHRNAIS